MTAYHIDKPERSVLINTHSGGGAAVSMSVPVTEGLVPGMSYPEGSRRSSVRIRHPVQSFWTL